MLIQTAYNASDITTDAAHFGAEVIAPNAERWNCEGSVPRAFFRDAAAHGLCGMLVAERDGGTGLTLPDFLQVLSALAGHCLASTFALVVHNNLAAAIARHGTAYQRERYLAAMIAGEQIGAFLLTEPTVGSDAQALTTRAEAHGDGWRITGAKAWITNAVHADVLSVYAQTIPGAGARGIGCWLIDANAPGVSHDSPYDLLGGHALGTGGFRFDACEVAHPQLLHAPGDAFRAALQGIDIARLAVAAMCEGMLACALSEAIRFTRERPAFGQMIGDFQGVQWLLADVATDLEAARALTASVAAKIAQGGAVNSATAHAKKFATRVAFTRIADCMQVMGAAGLSRTRPLARHLAAAKIAQYLDGATEIQNVVIARALGDYAR